MTAHPARTRRWTYWVPIVGLFTIGSAVRALRFGGRFAVRWHWDEAVPAIQAIHVLSGVLPVHFLGIEYIPSLLGAPGSGIRPVITGILPCILVLIVVVGRAVKRDARDLAWALGVRGGRARGGIVLWPVLVANLALVLSTPRGAESDRYLLPLYSVLPCWVGDLLCWLWQARRMLAGPAVAALLV